MQKELDLAVYITCGTNKNKRLNNSTVKRWQNRENTWDNKKKNKKEKKRKKKKKKAKKTVGWTTSRLLLYRHLKNFYYS